MNTLAALTNLFAGPDLFLILLIVLVLFGAKKLPELARGMGEAIKEFSKAKNEFDRELTRPIDEPKIQPAPEAQAHRSVAQEEKPAEKPVV